MESGASLQDLVDRLEGASMELEDRLVALRSALNETRSLLEREVPLSQVLAHSHCPAARGAAAAAAEELIDLLHDYRAETIRQLVDDEGWSITEIAKRSGNARQVIARLYHSTQRTEPPAAGDRRPVRARPRPKLGMTHPEG